MQNTKRVNTPQLEEAFCRLSALAQASRGPEMFWQAMASLMKGEVEVFSFGAQSNFPGKELERATMVYLSEISGAMIYFGVHSDNPNQPQSLYFIVGKDPTLWEKERELLSKGYALAINLNWQTMEASLVSFPLVLDQELKQHVKPLVS